MVIFRVVVMKYTSTDRAAPAESNAISFRGGTSCRANRSMKWVIQWFLERFLKSNEYIGFISNNLKDMIR